MYRKITTTAGIVFSLLLFVSTGFAAPIYDITLPGVGSYSGILDGGTARIGVGFDNNLNLVGGATGALEVVDGDHHTVDGSLFLGSSFGGYGQDKGPVAIELNEAASSFTFTIGRINARKATSQTLPITAWDALGNSVSVTLLDALGSPTSEIYGSRREPYKTYTIAPSDLTISSFRKILFGSNDDEGGWTYGQMRYTAAVPAPAAAWLLGAGLVGLIAVRRHT